MSRNVLWIRFAFSTITLAGLMLACAGAVKLPMVWIYLAVYWGLGFAASLIAEVSLDAERRQPGTGEIDPASRPAASFLLLATVAVSALDAGRFHWSGAVPWVIKFDALIVFVLASAVQNWAISANPFFSTAIRIQSERGHRVMTGGPYRFVRHPGYMAMAITMPATALSLGSLLALIPALSYSAVMLWRTNREDRFLKERLEGFSRYTGRVRYRLIPGLW